MLVKVLTERWRKSWVSSIINTIDFSGQSKASRRDRSPQTWKGWAARRVGDSECRFSRRTFIISTYVICTFERGPLFEDKRHVDESSIGWKVARVVDHSCNSLTRVVRTKLVLRLAPPTLSRSLGVRRNYTP